MSLVKVRSIFKEKEKFLGQEVELFGWVKNLETKRILDLLN